jgi:hypothetical protein
MSHFKCLVFLSPPPCFGTSDTAHVPSLLKKQKTNGLLVELRFFLTSPGDALKCSHFLLTSDIVTAIRREASREALPPEFRPMTTRVYQLALSPSR